MIELGAHVCNPWLGLFGPVFWLKSLGANGAFTVLRPCTVLGYALCRLFYFFFLLRKVQSSMKPCTIWSLARIWSMECSIPSHSLNYTPSFSSCRVVHKVFKHESSEQKFVIVCLYAVSCMNKCRRIPRCEVVTVWTFVRCSARARDSISIAASAH